MDQEYTPLDLGSLDLNAPLPTYQIGRAHV